jgi:hypothetical protein
MSSRLHDEIRQILLNDWDPSHAARFDAARGEYDSYLAPLAELIRSGADDGPIISYLHDRELESMCFPPLGTRHLQPVANKLLALRHGESP